MFNMLKNLFGKLSAHWRPAAKDEYVVVYVCDPDGMEQEAATLIHGCIDDINPDFADYLAPNGFLTIFSLARGGNERSRMYLQRLHSVLGNGERFNTIRTGQARGTLNVDLDERGRIRGRPLGITINAAMNDARE